MILEENSFCFLIDFFESLPYIIFMFNENLDILFLNDLSKNMFEEGSNISKYCSKDDKNRISLFDSSNPTIKNVRMFSNNWSFSCDFFIEPLPCSICDNRICQYSHNVFYIGCLFDIRDATSSLDRILFQPEQILFQNISSGFCLNELIFDDKNNPIDYRVLNVNPAFEKITGLKKEYIINKKASDCSNNVDNNWLEYFIKSVNSQTKLEFTGYSSYLKQNFSCIVLPTSQNLFACLFELISDKETIEQKIKQSNIIFNSTSDGLIITDSNFNIIYVNKAFTKITQYTEDDAIGNNPNILKSGKHPVEFYKLLWDFLLKNGYWQGEFINKRKDGTYYNQWSSLSLLKDDKNNIINCIAVISDISIIKEKEKEIEFLSTHDFLTKLPNRLSLNNHLKDLIMIPNNHFAIVYIDLDDFKSINDVAGHYIGDLVLISFSNKIKSIIKKTDFISRISGDEFVLVLDGVNNEIDLEKILKKLSETKININISEYLFTVNFSIGAVLYPHHTTNFNELLKFADIALYESKNKNKSSYTIYHPFQLNQVLRKLELIQEIKFCVEKNELFLNFQPQVNIKTGELVGVESLVRWNSIYFGEISPSVFIKIAEESNSILDIGKFVIEKSIQTISKWKESKLKYPKVAINFSIKQLEQNNIVDMVEEIRTKYKIEPDKIEIEITESIMMNKRTIIIDNLFRFKNLGYSIALDDFGTGFSSITYLSQLPINKIKLDKSFFENFQSQEKKNLLISIIQFIKNLNYDLLAEGVEDKEIAEFLLESGCDIIQGYLISKPISENDLETWFL